MASKHNTYLVPKERYHTLQDERNMRFFQLPKSLFDNPYYQGDGTRKPLSLGAKAAYAIIRDRLDLSRANNWADENGYIYLHFDVDSLGSILNVDRTTALRYKQELVAYELIVNKRIGQGNPNRIYVLKPLSAEEDTRLLEVVKCDFRKSQNTTSESGTMRLQEVVKYDPNHTNVIHTDLTDTDSIIPANQNLPQQTGRNERKILKGGSSHRRGGARHTDEGATRGVTQGDRMVTPTDLLILSDVIGVSTVHMEQAYSKMMDEIERGNYIHDQRKWIMATAQNIAARAQQAAATPRRQGRTTRGGANPAPEDYSAYEDQAVILRRMRAAAAGGEERQ